MNIFAVSPDPEECAKVLDDVRLNKMIVETAQLLSNGMHHSCEMGPYRPTHLNHPCTIWVSSDVRNYVWTLELFLRYLQRFQEERDKPHKSGEHYWAFHYFIHGRVLGALDTPPPDNFRNCTPFPSLPVHEAYRQCLLEKWSDDEERGRTPKWNGVEWGLQI